MLSLILVLFSFLIIKWEYKYVFELDFVLLENNSLLNESILHIFSLNAASSFLETDFIILFALQTNQ